ncbi:unnamed protein product [Protopolystoma xenopodis]|uniref:Uncharacterized protein n=1 Tax=Protopolystoma xenopodis TaxID=117903 RepID=A0A3S5C8D5_9PLAT|nr:unnamed protein product [Protopolystoma xenopodis]
MQMSVGLDRNASQGGKSGEWDCASNMELICFSCKSAEKYLRFSTQKKSWNRLKDIIDAVHFNSCGILLQVVTTTNRPHQCIFSAIAVKKRFCFAMPPDARKG